MVKVLFDHNMPPALARCLHELVSIDGHEAHALRDKFPPNISDIDLFGALAKEGNWIVISKDVKQAKRRAERTAIIRSKVHAFYLKPAVQKLSPNQQAATILWHWDNILKQQNLSEGGLFELPVNKGSKFTVM